MTQPTSAAPAGEMAQQRPPMNPHLWSVAPEPERDPAAGGREAALREAIAKASRIIAGVEPGQYIPEPYARLKAVQDILQPLAAAPAPQVAEPSGVEAPWGWEIRNRVDGFSFTMRNAADADGWRRDMFEVTPLFTHPPMPQASAVQSAAERVICEAVDMGLYYHVHAQAIEELEALLVPQTPASGEGEG